MLLRCGASRRQRLFRRNPSAARVNGVEVLVELLPCDLTCVEIVLGDLTRFETSLAIDLLRELLPSLEGPHGEDSKECVSP